MPDQSKSINDRLKAAMEVSVIRHLWTPADAITFIPRVLSTIHGDGRALFAIMTCNDRPAYWIVQGDSGWSSCDSRSPDDAPEFIDFVDDILVDLEDQFGRARCGYSGSSLRWPKEERDCDCEECQDEQIVEWPAVDDEGGCLWGRLDWPVGFTVEPHPWANCTILSEGAANGV